MAKPCLEESSTGLVVRHDSCARDHGLGADGAEEMLETEPGY